MSRQNIVTGGIIFFLTIIYRHIRVHQKSGRSLIWWACLPQAVRRTGMKRSNLEEKILDTATELFAEHGFVKASVRDIAKRVSGSNSCLYVYFKNKDEILFRIITDVGAELLKELETVTGKHDDPVESLRKMMFSQILFSIKATNSFWVSFFFL